VDAAHAAQPREVSQHKAQVAARLALAGAKLGASSPAGGPRLTARLVSRAPGGGGAVAPALALGSPGNPPLKKWQLS